jgi:energy-coupling factor transport system permease protein
VAAAQKQRSNMSPPSFSGERFRARMPRPLHPIAWWIWALGLAVAVSRTTNPILLGLVFGVLAIVVVNRRGDAPWSRAFRYYLYLALVVVVIRVLFRSIFGGDVDASTMHVWLNLPHIPLPSWAAGVQIGGAVTAEGTFSALFDGLMLGCLLCCIGAANTLANPKRALRVLPGALYELGVAVVVSLSVAPQLVESVVRIRRARKLRGGTHAGLHAMREVVIPVLEDALERSLRLAAAMDSRGYGRAGSATQRSRHLTGVLMLTGMCGLCVGAYGLLDSSLPRWMGLPSLLAGVILCVAGLASGGRRIKRSSYRPDTWGRVEWLAAFSGVLPAVVLVAGWGFSVSSLNPSTDPLSWPSLPILPAIAILIAVVPAFASPPRAAKEATRGYPSRRTSMESVSSSEGGARQATVFT